MKVTTRGALCVDIMVVAVAFALSSYVLRQLRVMHSGSIAVVICVLLATWRLGAAGESWQLLGLASPRSWGKVLLWVPVLYGFVFFAGAIVVPWLARLFGWPPTDYSVLGPIERHLALLVTLLAIAWTTAAFGEELLFRAFLLSRLERLFGGGKPAVIAAVLLQATLFGVGHAYLGIRGAMSAGLIGAIFGTLFVISGRNLWPLILAHGLTDTLSLLALYFGAGHPR
jgi:membrane protease YdiL (CAAX protease family)